MLTTKTHVDFIFHIPVFHLKFYELVKKVPNNKVHNFQKHLSINIKCLKFNVINTYLRKKNNTKKKKKNC